MASITFQKRWKARLTICGIMLGLAFLGLFIMDIHAQTYWMYTCTMAVIYALLNIWLFWYLNWGKEKSYRVTFWHQTLHWIALGGAIYLISLYIRTGLMNPTQAGLATLILLALTVFLMGVYTDSSFMLIGITLAIFAGGAVMLQAHIFLLMAPVILVAALIIYIMAQQEKRQQKKD